MTVIKFQKFWTHILINWYFFFFSLKKSSYSFQRVFQKSFVINISSTTVAQTWDLFRCKIMSKPLKRINYLEQYLGLIGFYRSFIRNFSEISQPLRRLTCEHVTIECDEKCENAFNTFKNLLSSFSVLAFPDANKPFIIETDASQHSIGRILSQRKPEGDVHPIGYYSLALSPREQKWSTYSK